MPLSEKKSTRTFLKKFPQPDDISHKIAEFLPLLPHICCHRHIPYLSFAKTSLVKKSYINAHA